MNISDKGATLAAASAALEGVYDLISAAGAVSLSSLQGKRALIVVDIINGFVREGAMSSPMIEQIIPAAAALMKRFSENGDETVVFADCHESNAAEFLSFPPHCIRGTSESELVDELKAIGGYTLIEKNSTNGFHEEKFRAWLEKNRDTESYIIIGDCTDICVMQFALSLRTWLNCENIKADVYLPLSAVETYDAPQHSAPLFGLCSVALMQASGIKIASGITL